MAVPLGGIDVLSFSGGVGENRPDVRGAIAERLSFLGEFKVEVTPTREEVVVARVVRGLVSS
jgi:acetate kinase